MKIKHGMQCRIQILQIIQSLYGKYNVCCIVYMLNSYTGYAVGIKWINNNNWVPWTHCTIRYADWNKKKNR